MNIIFAAVVTLACVIYTGEASRIASSGADAMPRYLFLLADTDHNRRLSFEEFHQIFLDFDINHNSEVTASEFLTEWKKRHVGSDLQAVVLFHHLDVNKDGHIQETDLPYIEKFFDRNGDLHVTEAEFVIQWLKMMSF